MKVLSLFDGMSCGRLALQRAGIRVDEYYSSEIDPHALMVANMNWPDDRTLRLGNITGLEASSLPKIDLLIGGSPCTQFSSAGLRTGMTTIEGDSVVTLERYLELKSQGVKFHGQSYLFFEYVRLLNELKPRYFLLENVQMKKVYQDVITKYLGVEPVLINSADFSKQDRKRLYWTNIPILQWKPTKEMFNRHLYRLGHGYITDEIKLYEKYPCLAAQSPATKYRIIENLDLAENATFAEMRKDKRITRSATPEECEEFQTLPIGYTSCVPKTHRYKMIGNAWTVDVIAHILKGIT